MNTLSKKHCVPCEGGAQPLDPARVAELLKEIPKWALHEKGIRRTFSFPTYKESVAFAVRVAMLAEEEVHHPDMTVRYGGVDVVLWTHSIGGLSENDFIVAAKIDALE